MFKPMYTIRKVTAKDVLYGPIHGTDNSLITLCGKDISKKAWQWYIVTTNYDGDVTCKSCKKKIKENEDAKV